MSHCIFFGPFSNLSTFSRQIKSYLPSLIMLHHNLPSRLASLLSCDRQKISFPDGSAGLLRAGGIFFPTFEAVVPGRGTRPPPSQEKLAPPLFRGRNKRSWAPDIIIFTSKGKFTLYHFFTERTCHFGPLAVGPWPGQAVLAGANFPWCGLCAC